MSGRKSIIKAMAGLIFLGAIFLIFGGALLASAKTKLDSYAVLESQGLKVVGVIQSVKTVTEKELTTGRRSWKTRNVAEVLVEYEGSSYHDSVDVTSFMQEGDPIEVYLDTAAGQMIPLFSTTGNLLNFLSYVPGGFVTLIGVVIVLGAIISAVGRFSLFKEENKVYGVIAEVKENRNIIVNGKHPKKAVCEITDPVTGEARRIETANSEMDLFGMIGMNVPVYINPKKPKKYFVDLENATGELQLAEGQQRVHDLRKL